MTAEMAGGERGARAAIAIERLSKSFVDGKPVLADVDLAIGRGEVRALLGANGSGKSTLVKILAGYHSPDRGTKITVDGRALPLPVDPDEVRDAGVRFVHQEHGLVSGMSVVDNLRLGRPYFCGPGWKIRWKQEAAAARAMFSRLGVDVDPMADVEGLPLPTLAKLSILRALGQRSGDELRLVVLDEPTASLGQQDAAQVLAWVRELARLEDVGVLFVSHRLSEVFAVADTISILRNGRVVASGPAGEFTPDGAVEAIVGRRVEAYYPKRAATPLEPVLAVRALTAGQVQEISFTVRRGEVLGLTGLAGAGFEDIPYLLADRHPDARGSCSVDGKEISLRSCPVAERIRYGIALAPADRLRMALAADASARENVVLPRLPTFVRRGLLRRPAERADAARVMAAFQVTPADSETTVGQLSGGNQQKLLVGKWLATAPKVLLLHEPTQGVDVSARHQIFSALAAFADKGGAVVVASVEYEDLAHICDRVLVLGRGKVRSELAGAQLSPETVSGAAYLADISGAAA